MCEVNLVKIQCVTVKLLILLKKEISWLRNKIYCWTITNNLSSYF